MILAFQKIFKTRRGAVKLKTYNSCSANTQWSSQNAGKHFLMCVDDFCTPQCGNCSPSEAAQCLTSSVRHCDVFQVRTGSALLWSGTWWERTCLLWLWRESSSSSSPSSSSTDSASNPGTHTHTIQHSRIFAQFYKIMCLIFRNFVVVF